MEEKKQSPVASAWRTLRTYVPVAAGVTLALTLVCAILHIIARFSTPFADWVNTVPAAGVRFLLAKISGILPFSIAELLIMALPAILVFLIIGAVHYAKSKQGFWRYLSAMLSALGLLYSLFVLTIGCGYQTTTLDQQLGLAREKVSVAELYETAGLLLEETAARSEEIARVDGASTMPFSFAEMNDRLLEAYEQVTKEHPFIQSMRSRLKAVTLSEAMSYTHITGVYTYMTGEANLNIAFPDYTLPFTAAHELAHQRGIAREDEANFVAFLVCIASDDPYIQYSGYFNMLEYVASALYQADPETYYALLDRYSKGMRQETIAYRAFFEKYQDSVVGEISGNINNSYLQMQGTPGTQSYGMVVDLAVAYYKQK